MIRLAPALLLLLSACDEQATAPLVISDIVITEAIPGQTMSAGFMTLRNNSNETIEVTAVTSREFNAVAIHESSIEDGIARMRPLETLTVAAKSSIALQPGGIHLMLMRPTATDKGNDEVSLSFYGGETLLLNVSTQISRGAH
jgi:copper(I)-binding protein